MPTKRKASKLSLYSRLFPDTQVQQLWNLKNTLNSHIYDQLYFQADTNNAFKKSQIKPNHFHWIYKFYDFSTLSDWLALFPGNGARYFFLSHRRQMQLAGDDNHASLKDFNEAVYQQLQDKKQSVSKSYLDHLNSQEAKIFPSTGSMFWQWIKWTFFALLAVAAIGTALTGLGLMVHLALGGSAIASLGTVPVLKSILSFLATTALNIFPNLALTNLATLTWMSVVGAVVGTVALHRVYFDTTFNLISWSLLKTVVKPCDPKHIRYSIWGLPSDRVFSWKRFLINPARWLNLVVLYLCQSVMRTIKRIPWKPVSMFLSGAWQVLTVLILMPVQILVKIGDIPMDYIFPTIGKLIALVATPFIGASFIVHKLFGGRWNAAQDTLDARQQHELLKEINVPVEETTFGSNEEVNRALEEAQDTPSVLAANADLLQSVPVSFLEERCQQTLKPAAQYVNTGTGDPRGDQGDVQQVERHDPSLKADVGPDGGDNKVLVLD